MQKLLERIEKKSSPICVIGLGQVGLPTALAFSKSGFVVNGFDINEKTIDILKSGKSPFSEFGLDDLIKTCIENKKFNLFNDLKKSIENSDIVIVCVGTPITDDIRPNLSTLTDVCKKISDFSNEKLIIIESSIPPGTFDELVLPLIKNDFELGKDFFAAHVPERLTPGKALLEIQSTPRLIGCKDKNSKILSCKLYENIVNSEIITSEPKLVEISKLVENTFRDVNIAFANEVALICEQLGIDSHDLIKLCNSHPRVNVHTPGPGVGGPCLPKDPYLLIAQNSEKLDSKLIMNSRKINDNMPHHVIKLILSALLEQQKKPEKSTITILGVSYKPNVSDTRYSPAKTIIQQLIKKGCKVFVDDPNSNENFGGETVSDVWNAIKESDVLTIITDHDEYSELNLKMIQKTMKSKPVIVDTRRLFDKKMAEQLGINYISVGYKNPN